MRRRDLFAAGAALAVSAPAVAQNSRATTLRMAPQANLSVLDPVFTTATVTGNHGFYVFDTLYGVDAQLRPTPQMAEGHEVSADGLTWRIKLREGLRFHDGEPVRAVDCIASIRRWCAREPFGQLLARVAEEWIAADDRTMVIRLRRPFPLLLDALAKPDAASPFIMPARLAATDPSRAVTEMVGSGPYRFIANEFNSGSRVVYEVEAMCRGRRRRHGPPAPRSRISGGSSGISCRTPRRRPPRSRPARSIGGNARTPTSSSFWPGRATCGGR